MQKRRQTDERLGQAREELEQRVLEQRRELGERDADLKQLHDVTVGRELRMMELEREVERLHREVEQLKRTRQ
jgi:hypothetical protein